MHAFEDHKGTLGLLDREYGDSSKIARLVCCTTPVLLVTLILVGGYAFLADHAPVGAQPFPWNCRLTLRISYCQRLGTPRADLRRQSHSSWRDSNRSSEDVR
jgi:hypothetical protein